MKLNKSVKSCDKSRLMPQLERVKKFMLRGRWVTLAQITKGTGAPEASASARLRDLKNNGLRVEKKRVKNGNGLYVYRMIA